MPKQNPPKDPPASGPKAIVSRTVDLTGPEDHCWMNVSAAQRRKGAPLTPAELRRIYNGHIWYTTVEWPDRIEGGMLGFLTGDAAGVPYEFYRAEDLPRLDDLSPQPPKGFRRAHASAPPVAWSDDGAQGLCLLDSLLFAGRLDPDDFARRLVNWYHHGHMAVNAVVFDVGIQTAQVLDQIGEGVPWAVAAPENDPNKNGNGSLAI